MTSLADVVTVDSVESLSAMSAEEVDDLPYGFLILDAEGTILLYNRYESRMSRLLPEHVIGRRWFSNVAPCTRVEAFFGRFRRLVETEGSAVDRFSFRFHFMHGAQDVVVQLSKVAGTDARVFMTVVRRNVEGFEVDLPGSSIMDEDRGVVVGPLGTTLPIPAPAMARFLDRIAPEEARELGMDTGRSLARAAETAARSAGASDLEDAPLLFRSGVLDAAIARAGLGRLALDLSARRSTGAIGVMLRPPSPAISAGLACFYEGVLSAMLGASVGESLTARCLDERHGAPVPWLFAAVPVGSAALLADAGVAGARDISRRLGLFVDDGGEEAER